MTADDSRPEFSPATQRLIASIEAQLRPLGWDVTSTYRLNRVRVRVGHELSGNHGIVWPEDGKDYSEFVAGFLSDHEFKVIAARPPLMPHGALIGKIRTAARANDWDARTVAIVGRLLRSEGLLTDEEADWLEEAGPAWVETDE